eukprot:TRINITY_DN37522_c0_g1_i1.p1 TRINITY_DN37522_c0_g1~~TRINITY_DN37522_c0_g1_i1.p1  ORF type:complete len:103 (-),score=3.04 TRINITY_DN37522_c0_g1_i1:296-604(-)
MMYAACKYIVVINQTRTQASRPTNAQNLAMIEQIRINSIQSNQQHNNKQKRIKRITDSNKHPIPTIKTIIQKQFQQHISSFPSISTYFSQNPHQSSQLKKID